MSQAGYVGAVAAPSFASQLDLAVVVDAAVEEVAVVALVVKIVDEVAATSFTGSAWTLVRVNKEAADAKTVTDDAFADVVLPQLAGCGDGGGDDHDNGDDSDGGGDSGGGDWRSLGRGG